MRFQRIFGIPFLILELLLSLTPGTLVPACPMEPDGGSVRCHWMDVAKQSVTAVVIFGSPLAAFWPAVSSGGTAATSLVLGAKSFTPTKSLTDGCRVREVACNLYMHPLTYVLSGLLIAINAVALYCRLTEKAKRGGA